MASIKLKGDTSGEITISAPAVAGTTTLTLPATSSTLATQNALGVRNLIINGDMRIAQRGTSASGLTTTDYRTVDRFKTTIETTGTWTQTQDNDVPTGQGFANSLKMQCTTANASLVTNNRLRIEQFIEGQNLQHLANGTANANSITVSFWVKSNKTGTYTVNFYKGNSTARAISKTYTINTSNTWEKKTITYVGDTTGGGINNDNASGLNMYFWLASGPDYTAGTFNNGVWENFTVGNWVSPSQVNLADSTSNYINITGVQLEVGDTATPFEHRPYDMELARCQRYCVNLLAGTSDAYGVFMLGQNNSATQVRGIITSPSQMRVSPSIEYGGSFQAQGGWGDRDVTAFSTTGRTGSQYMEIIIDTLTGLTGGNASQIRRKNDANAYFRLTAEL